MTLNFQAIGTTWDIKLSDDAPHSLKQQILKRISDFEKTYSRFKDDSFVSKISKATGEFTLPEDAKPMLDLYFDLFEQTGGSFTPLIGQNLIEAGYDKDYSLSPKDLTKIDGLVESVEYNFPVIKIKKSSQFDFGGVGKGYLIDIISDIIIETGAKSFTVNAGGDLFSYNSEGIPISAGLEHPNEVSKVIGRIEVLNQSLGASSGNRRNWGKYNHIIDPTKMESPKNILSTWVVADKAIIADSIATCLFLVPSSTLSRYYDYEYLILYSDFSIEKSEGFDAEIYYG